MVLVILAGSPLGAVAKTVEELREEINARRQEIKNAEARITKFKEDIQLKKKEARTLEDQIDLIDENIKEVELTITRTLAEIEKTNAEIAEVAAEIAQREEEIAAQKARLAEYIRAMHALDQQSTITVFLKYETFSDAVTEAATYGELQNRGQETLVAVQQLRDELATKQRELEDFKQTLEALQARQEQQQATLAVQRNSKARILELTNAQEAKYQDLLRASQQAHQAAEADIRTLDKLLREELRKQGIGKLPSVGTLDWPVEPTFGVSCGFRCVGYPYEYLIGPHAGIDIPTYVGTPIKAPADGYVARLHDAGGPGYSYILLLHGDEISTVYGHVSGFATQEGQLITRGTVIGYTGGAAGSRGSGLSSGPHLHFEVRRNNVPLNPSPFLP